MKSLFEMPMELSAKVLDMRMQRQNIVMSNLANIKTPQYKARRVEFEEELQSALGLDGKGRVTTTNPHHLPGAFDSDSFSAKAISDLKPRVIHGEDAVDLDKEMAVMAKNTLSYNALTTVLQKSFEGVKNIIADGGRS